VTLDLSGLALQGTLFSTCLYSGTVGQQIALTPEGTYEEAWRTGSLTELAEERLSLVSGSGCPTTARVSGTLTLTPQQNMRRFIGRLAIAGGSIAREREEEPVFMRNGSPNGFPSIRVNPIPLNPIELVNVDVGDAAEMFRLVEARNFCWGATLPADGVTVCSTEVRYIETAAREQRAHMKILPESNGGVATVYIPIIALR